MIRKYTGATIIAFFVIVLAILLLPNYGVAYNKSWDQGHKCVTPGEGEKGWGRYGYDTQNEGDIKGSWPTKDCCKEYCEICPVYANTGRLKKTFTDLMLPGTGPSLSIVRTYLSQDWATSLLGRGWVFNFGRKLTIVRSREGDKRVIVRRRTGEMNFFKENPDGTLELLADYGVTYHLTKNSDGTYIIAEKNGLVQHINTDGKPVSIIDKNGNQLMFEYNSVSCLSRITNASGNYVDFQLGPNGKIASISDNLGRTIAYVYDQNGNLTSSTDPMGYTTQYVNDSENRLTQVIDPRGNIVFSVTYDNFQPPRVATFTEKGETWTISYHDDHTVKTDSSGNTWTYYFNDVGVIERVIDPLGNVKQQQLNKVTSISVDWADDLNGNRTTYSYDSDGNIATITDPLGNTWANNYISGTNLKETEIDKLGRQTRFEYDNNGNLIRKIEDYEGTLKRITSYTYNNIGLFESITNPLGNTTLYEYNSDGNITKITSPSGKSNTFSYDNRGNILSKTDPNGNTVTYNYDLMNRVITKTDALGNTTAYAYDANGNRISETDPSGNITSVMYDTYNRLIQKTDPMGNTLSWTYDSKDNIISKTDVNGNTTVFAYNILNYLISRIDAFGNTTSFVYDNNGNMLTKTDANGNTTTYTYDGLNRLLSISDLLGNTASYAYDASGNIVTTTDANGNTTQFEYNIHGKRVKQIRPMAQEVIYQHDVAGDLVAKINENNNKVEFGYDADGKMVSTVYYAATDHNSPVKTVTYSYDNTGNMVGYVDGITSATYVYDNANRKIAETINYGTFTLTYSYSYNGNGTKNNLTMPGGISYAYTYNANNQIAGIQIPGVGLISYNSYSAYKPSSITLPGGITKNYSYDQLMRVSTIASLSSDQNSIMNYQYAYDNLKNILTKNTEHGNYTYVYDGLYRITNVDNPVLSDESFTYDAVGNRLTESGISGSWVYNQNNELLNYSNLSYEYDNSGNMIRKTEGSHAVNYMYDEDNRLVRVANELGDIIAEYYYDPSGRRLWKSVGGTKIYFLYCDEGLAGEYDENGTAIKTYGYKPNSAWMTDPLFIEQGGEYFFYQSDHLGTPQMITDVNDNIVWSAKNNSFGEASIEVNTIENNLRFSGQYFDEETSLIQNRYRYYDHSTGRYNRKDIILIDDLENHQYVYANNNPVNFSDNYGLVWWCYGLTKAKCISRGTWTNPNYRRHKRRNSNNHCPKLKPHPTGLFGWGGHEDCLGNKWEKDKLLLGIPDFHGYGLGNRTFRRNRSQCTYGTDGNLITSGQYMGTYDYGEPGTKDHCCHDVIPHLENSNYVPNLTNEYNG